MNTLNFRTLENLKAPDALKEKLLLIPETSEQKPVAIPLWRRRAIAAAASLLFITALSVTVYFLFGNKPNTAVPVSPLSTDAAWQTNVAGETVAAVETDYSDSSTTSVDERQAHTQPTGQKSATEHIVDLTLGSRGSTAPTFLINPTTGSGFAEGGKRQPTERGDNAKPSYRPNEAPTLPTEPEAEPPWVQPTEAGWDSPTEDRVPPTATPWMPPTEALSYPRTITVQLSKRFSGLTAADTVYVSVFDGDGSRLGDSDPYASEHIAQTDAGAVSVTVSYSPADHRILPEDGVYRYEVYNSSGRTLASGTAKLSAS